MQITSKLNTVPTSHLSLVAASDQDARLELFRRRLNQRIWERIRKRKALQDAQEQVRLLESWNFPEEWKSYHSMICGVILKLKKELN